jgi:hypothetical protein
MLDVEMLDHPPKVTGQSVEVIVKTPLGFERDAYAVMEGEKTVQKVLQETMEKEGLFYKVRFQDTHTEVVSLIFLSNPLTHYPSYM